METPERYVGTTKWFATSGQSYGFIRYYKDGMWRDVYCHYKSIGTQNLRDESKRGEKWHLELRKGDVVEFSLAEGFGMPTGTQAIDVRVLSWAQT